MSCVAALPSGRRPGEVYEYSGVNTFVLSWLAEQVSGRPFAEVLGREIWATGGFEAPAQLCGSASGAPGSHGGLSTTLRDLARFGMLFTPSGRLVAQSPVISQEHLRRIQTGGRPELHDDRGPRPDYVTDAYGSDRPPASRQWNFAMADGDLFKGGFGGQGLYISPARDLVIAFAGIPRPDGSASWLRWFRRSPLRVAAPMSLCNRRRMARRAELNDVIPVLPARDVSEAVQFYVERLGFELLFQDSDHRPQYAGIRRGAVELHLQFQFEKDFEAGIAGQAMLRLAVDDPDVLFEEYEDRDVFHDGTQLRDTSWSTREFAFWDLNHNGLTFMRDL